MERAFTIGRPRHRRVPNPQKERATVGGILRRYEKCEPNACGKKPASRFIELSPRGDIGLGNAEVIVTQFGVDDADIAIDLHGDFRFEKV